MAGTGQTDVFLAALNQGAAGSVPVDAYEPNGVRTAATNLGVINAQQTVDGLTLHSTADEDWFRFDLLTAAEAANAIQLEQLGDPATVRLELYNGATRVGTSTVTGRTFRLSLGDLHLPAATYHLRVFGASAPTAYKLAFQMPRALTPDNRESNDTPDTATDLGTVRAVTTLTGLTIHAAGNDDWFRFSTVAAGAAPASVRIDFRNADGDLDLELYDSLGTTRLRASSGATNTESISLGGLAAGTYFVRVVGFNGALSPGSALTVTPPPELIADRFEPNDSRLTATPLDTVRGTQTWDGLSVHAANNEDWFSFSTIAAATFGNAVRIDFQNALGDLDLRLYDSNYRLLAASAGGHDGEQVSLAGLPAGTYYAQVFGYNGAVQPSYQLVISAPASSVVQPDRIDQSAPNNTRLTATPVRNEGASTLSGVQTLTDLSLNSAVDQDWYTFTTVGPGKAGHSLQLTYDAGGGAFALELTNAAGVRVGTLQAGTGTQRVSLAGLPAGTYFARVSAPSGATGGYSLTFDTPTPDNRDDWTVLVYMTADNLVNRAFADVNELEQAAAGLPGTVNLAMLWDQSAALTTFATGNGAQPAWGTTGRALVAPDTDPNTVATRFELLPEQNTGSAAALRSFVQWATATAPARHYALVFWDHGGGLRGFNYDKSDGLPADQLTPIEVSAALAGLPRMDLIAFDACFMATAEVAYSFRGLTDVVVGSQDVIPGAGFDYTSALSALATNPGQVTAEGLATGMVKSYARQYGASGTGDTLSTIRTAALSPLTQALQLFATSTTTATSTDRALLATLAAGTLLPNAAVLDQRDLGDYFTRVFNEGRLDQALKQAAESVLSCLDDAVISKTSDGRDSSGLSVYLPVRQNSGQTTIDRDLYPSYRSQYGDFTGASGWYDLLTALAGSGGDRPDSQDAYDTAGRNDVYSTATDLRRLVGPGHIYDGLSLHDETDRDWYRFQIDAPAGSSLTVTITVGVGATSSLVVSLRDASGKLLLDGLGNPRTLSVTAAQPGSFVLTGLPAGPAGYTLFFQSAAPVPDYQFTIDAPGTGPDWAGSNDTAAKAYTLDPQADATLGGLSLAAGAQDWFRFPTPVLLTPELRQMTVTASGGAVLEAQLRDASGAVVAAASGAGTLVLPYTHHGQGETYTLSVRNPSESTVPYTLRLELAAPGGPFPFDTFARVNGSLGASWATTGNPQIVNQAVTMAGTAPQALWQGFSAADSAVQTRFRLAATGNVTATVLLRHTVASNGKVTRYEGRIVRLNGALTAQLYRVENGIATLLGKVALKPTLEGILRLDAVGRRVRLLVDSRILVDVTDTRILAAGKAGLAGTPGVTFDDFLANSTDQPLPLVYGTGTDAGLGGAWVPVTGAFTVQDQRVLAGAKPATAVYGPASLTDVTLSASYTLAAGQSVSLLARNSGTGTARTYYEGRLTLTGATMTASIVRVVKGVAVTLPNLISPAPPVSTSGQVQLMVQGNLLQLLVNGVPVARRSTRRSPCRGRSACRRRPGPASTSWRRRRWPPPRPGRSCSATPSTEPPAHHSAPAGWSERATWRSAATSSRARPAG
ncbi:MAG: clostripain-related cysteine peptidase [Gemmataceae bacterium]